MAASNTRSPAAQRYTGFPGVRAYIGAPGVIVFSPRRSPGRAARIPAPLPNQEQSTAVFSPPGPDSDEEENARNQQQGDRVTFEQVWALCGVTVATLTLPVGLFILSYVGTSGAHFSPVTNTKTVSATSTLYTGSLPTSSGSTPDPFQGVPSHCLRPVSVNTNFTLPSSGYIKRDLPARTRKIFCLFNSSRLGLPNRPDLTPYEMPLHYCGGIVYWSVGVAGGEVRSRVESLDTTVGLYRLKQLLKSLGLIRLPVLVTVGGYPQESAHFSRLGADPGAMARFVSSLMRIIWGHGLNGVAIHWVQPEPGCGRPGDTATLSSMVDAIRQAYRVVGRSASGDIAIMLPAEDTVAAPVVGLLANRVEWFFLETHFMQPFLGATTACSEAASRMIGTLQYVPTILPGSFTLSVVMGNEKPTKGFRSAVLSPADNTSPPGSRLLTPTIFRGDGELRGRKTAVGAAHTTVRPGMSQMPRTRQEPAPTDNNSLAGTMPRDKVEDVADQDRTRAVRSMFHLTKNLPAPSAGCRPTTAGAEEGVAGTLRVSPVEGFAESGRTPDKSPGKNAEKPTNRHIPDKVPPSRAQTVPPKRQGGGEFGSPRGNRPMAASNTRSPAAQRYTGFPGMRAYIGAPGVIVFSPRRSPGRAARIPDTLANQGQSPAVFSPPGPDSEEEEEARDQQGGSVTFLQVWALCGVTVATLTLPVGLFILSYMGTRGAHFSQVTNAKTVSATSTLYTGPLPTSSGSTPDRFQGVPSHCLRPVSVNTNFTLRSSGYIKRDIPARTRKIFCLFNSSRLGLANRPDLTPYEMPLHYCGEIVYWSVGVAGREVRSRVESFDTTIGLYRLKELLKSLGLIRTPVLVTVGGYPQESAHFSRLGADQGAMARFVSSLMRIIWGHGLNGVAIHWAQPEPGCGRPRDTATLSSMVDAIRQAYRVVGRSASGDITIMLPAEATVAGSIIRHLIDRVEWIFLETHLLQPVASRRTICSDMATRVLRLIADFRAGPNEQKVNSTNRCALLYDIDMDNFRESCQVLNASFFTH
ncbi:hypothetical protein V5799_027747 [Amblyomma americanum]|uniref:GH18 domain-containing protein n=1 Tax=Amblyomma americanum TaxID=6943 RepID=A0AAQ4DEU5_AMBAM